MKLSRYYKKLLTNAVKIAYEDSDTIEERNLINLIDKLEVNNNA